MCYPCSSVEEFRKESEKLRDCTRHIEAIARLLRGTRPDYVLSPVHRDQVAFSFARLWTHRERPRLARLSEREDANCHRV